MSNEPSLSRGLWHKYRFQTHHYRDGRRCRSLASVGTSHLSPGSRSPVEGGREGGREGEREGGREGGREGEREGGREGGREGEREREREGER